MAARIAHMRRADLSPPLGEPGGPCQVVDRIEERIRNPGLRRELVQDVESNEPISNRDAAKIYPLDVEHAPGVPGVIQISPHAQYRMDLRKVTVPDVQASLKAFFKSLNDLKSTKNPGYARMRARLDAKGRIEWTDPKTRITIVFVQDSPGTYSIITAYVKGEPDPMAEPGACEAPDRREARSAAAP